MKTKQPPDNELLVRMRTPDGRGVLLVPCSTSEPQRAVSRAYLNKLKEAGFKPDYGPTSPTSPKIRG
jgi:hypothetical protein